MVTPWGFESPLSHQIRTIIMIRCVSRLSSLFYAYFSRFRLFLNTFKQKLPILVISRWAVFCYLEPVVAQNGVTTVLPMGLSCYLLPLDKSVHISILDDYWISNAAAASCPIQFPQRTALPLFLVRSVLLHNFFYLFLELLCIPQQSFFATHHASHKFGQLSN